jgi:cytoskeletal protein CcmA (bactofilin family)
VNEANCFPELTYSIYADGELPAGEAREVLAHIEACSRCHDLVESLRVENRMLAVAVEEMDGTEAVAPVPVAAPPCRPLLQVGLPMLAALVALRVGVGWLAGWLPSGSTDWINPITSTGFSSLAFTGLFNLAHGGYAVLGSIMTVVAALGVLFVLTVGLVYCLRRRPLPLAVPIALSLFLMAPAPGAALDTRTGASVTVPEGETVDESLAATGENVYIEGVVDGGLLASARRVVVRGVVKGDLYVFAQYLDIEGTVEGTIHAWAQTIRLNGRVTRDAYIGGDVFQTGASGEVGRDAVLFVQSASLEGKVHRDMGLVGRSLDLRGTVGRNSRVHVEAVSLQETARVGGDLTIHIPDEKMVQIAEGSIVAGETEVKPPRGNAAGNRYLAISYWGWAFVWLVAAVLVGLLFYWLFPGLFDNWMDRPMDVARTLGLGFLVLVVGAVGCILAAVTLVGLPLAAVGAALLGVGIYLAKIVAAEYLGELILRRGTRGRQITLLGLVVGLAVVYLLIHLPWIGSLVNVLVTLLGLGMVSLQVYKGLWRRRRGALEAAA